jgi:hypothetical protein
LLIPLFFVSIGLSSDYRALSGHWTLMLLILLVAVVGKVVGCGTAALASGMDWVRSLRIGLGMMSRGEVGLIVTAMGATTGIFGRTEVAVMVTVVLLTTLLTPLALRGAFGLTSAQDIAEGLNGLGFEAPGAPRAIPTGSNSPPSGSPPDHISLRVATPGAAELVGLTARDATSRLK